MKHLILFFLLFTSVAAHAQVGIGTATPAATAQLDVSSTTKGFLPPRMTTAQRDLIGTPATGLVIFNTTLGSLQLYTDSEWSSLATAKTVNYPGASYRDLTTFSFTQSSTAPGLALPSASTNILLFHQPANVSISYISVTYANSSGSPASLNFALIDMTGVNYIDASGGTLIGNIFSIPFITSQTPITQEINTAGPYTSLTGRPVAIRLTASLSNRIVILSISIGYSVP